MNLNFKKTKEMCMDVIRESLPPQITVEGNCIDRVDSLEVLGIIIRLQAILVGKLMFLPYMPKPVSDYIS